MDNSILMKIIRWLLFLPFAFIGYFIVVIFIGKLVDWWYEENLLLYILIGYASGVSFMTFGVHVVPLKNKYTIILLFLILSVFAIIQSYSTYINTNKFSTLVTLQSFFTICGASMFLLFKWNNADKSNF